MNGTILRLRNKEINPNLAYNNKKKYEQRKSKSKAYKKVKAGILGKIKKAKDTGKSNLGFLG